MGFDGPSAFFEAGAPVVPAGPVVVSPHTNRYDELSAARGTPPPSAATPVHSPGCASQLQPQSQPQANFGFRFPAVRSVLWDSTEQGPKVFVGTEEALPDIMVPGSALAALSAALQGGDSTGVGSFTASVGSRELHDVPPLEVESYGPGVGSLHAGHIGLEVVSGRADLDAVRQDAESAFGASLRSRDATSAETLLKPRFVATLVAGPEGSAGQLGLQVSAEVLAPSATLVATPIRLLRYVLLARGGGSWCGWRLDVWPEHVRGAAFCPPPWQKHWGPSSFAAVADQVTQQT
jgi:hypothetical protein